MLSRSLSVAALALAVSACGGEGGGGVAAYSPPPSTPTPTPAPTATAYDPGPIFASAASQQFAILNASKSGDTLAIRYDAATKVYDVSIDGGAYQPLRPFDVTPNNSGLFYSFGAAADHGYVGLDVPGGFSYSRIGAFRQTNPKIDGLTAFGMATPAGSVPMTGAARFTGPIEGITDASAGGGFAGAGGTVQLSFDFTAGTLSGALHPLISWSGPFDGGAQDLGTYTFTNTVFSPGSTVFSGQFTTTVAGANGFNGQFTGPAAEELIGKWTLPFVWSSDPNAGGDGLVHSASGVMIAKQ